MSDEPRNPDLEDSIEKIDRAIGGDHSEANIDALKQAVNFSWPEIQKHLIEEAAREHGDVADPYEPYWTTNSDGTRTLHASADAWWLKDFKREDVLMALPGVVIMNTKLWHVRSVCISYRRAYGINEDEDCEDCFDKQDIEAHIERFPEGQFAAQLISGPNAGHCAGMATTMRASRPPTDPILPWLEAIGGMRLGKHEADGDWLYGVEMAVHPGYRGQGIGAALYEARFALVKHLNLRGMYAVGMLMGYRNVAVDALKWRQKRAVKKLLAKKADRYSTPDDRYKANTELEDFPKYADLMDVREYGEKVIARAIKDPTVTMQMNRGFRAQRVVTDYCDEPAAGDAGVLIVWENADYET
ncbi:MAG: GNAT family N-acetyltransferase [Chloroflexi bacterium]|nr:GNAT family N-acetyltransferase [Chloroflexota bacterium]